MTHAPFFVAHAQEPDANSHYLQSTEDSCCICRNEPQEDVGLSPCSQTQVQAELDEVIQQLATASALAEDAGNIETAKEYARRMQAAIASRTPEHVARLEREAWQRVDDSCFTGAWAVELAQTR